MGFMAAIFEWIAKTIQKIIEGIKSAIEWIGKKLLPFIAGIGAAIVGGTLLLGIFGPGAAGAVFTAVKGAVSAIGSVIGTIGHTAFAAVKWGITNLASTFQSFMQAIHFKELLQFHKIALILSKDYRDMMNKVYKQISDFSNQVFGNAEMMHLLLQSSRQLIYSLSATVGAPVDIAEIEYVQYLDLALQKIGDNAERYRDNPESVLDDMAEWVYSPITEKYSEVNRGFIQTISGLVEGVDAVAKEVFTINEQTQAVVSYLPQPLRGTLQDALSPIDKRITDFRYDIYEPRMSELEHVINQADKTAWQNRDNISALTDRLINPVDYIKELNLKPPKVRFPEKVDLRETINEDIIQGEREDTKYLDTVIEEIDLSKAAAGIPLPEPPPAPAEMKLEPKEPEKLPSTPGWFVGDY